MKTFIDFKNDIDSDFELRTRYIEILDKLCGDDEDITPQMSVEAAAELGYDTNAAMFEEECRSYMEDRMDEELSINALGAVAGGGVSYSDFIRQWINIPA